MDKILALAVRLLILNCLTMAALSSDPVKASTEAVKSSVSNQQFTYKAKSLKDPFMPLSAAGPASVTEKEIIKSERQVQDEFDPHELVIKGLLSVGTQSKRMAVLSNQTGTQIYWIKDSKIQHAATRFFIKNYIAKVEKDHVFIKNVREAGKHIKVLFPQSKEDTAQ